MDEGVDFVKGAGGQVRSLCEMGGVVYGGGLKKIYGGVNAIFGSGLTIDMRRRF